jgi:hypothetical protein
MSLRCLGGSLTCGLTSAAARAVVASRGARIPRLSLSRRVAFTDRFTQTVSDLLPPLVAWWCAYLAVSSHLLTFPVNSSSGLKLGNHRLLFLGCHRKPAMLHFRFTVHRDGKSLALVIKFEYESWELKLNHEGILGLRVDVILSIPFGSLGRIRVGHAWRAKNLRIPAYNFNVISIATKRGIAPITQNATDKTGPVIVVHEHAFAIP